MKPYLAAMIASALLCALSCTRKPDFGPSQAFHSTRFPETRSMSEAKLWLIRVPLRDSPSSGDSSWLIGPPCFALANLP
jgi:hypothetical protein